RADARHRGPGLHHVRGEGAGGRYGARAGVQRPGGRRLLRSDAHRAAARASGAGGMKPGLHQHTSLRQDLRINPRLYQAMDLLYMPLLDLQQHLKQELLGNPFLELVEPEEEQEPPTAQETAAEKEKEKAEEEGPDWESILLDDGAEAMAASRDF